MPEGIDTTLRQRLSVVKDIVSWLLSSYVVKLVLSYVHALNFPLVRMLWGVDIVFIL